ncbi:MAG: DUF86 domain-containing protein [Chitinophagales bacterium]|nr:DUF86 domain-containing protein [Chitinophagales bacterium]
MKRIPRFLVEDILRGIEYIEQDVKGLTFESFITNRLVRQATERNLSIIGEAINQLPVEFRTQHPEIEWRDIVDFRNKVIHEYFGINYQIIWEVIQDDLPVLKKQFSDVKFEQ